MTDEQPEVVMPETVPPPPVKGAAALVAIGDRGIMLRSMEDLLRFARLAVEGGAAPKGMSAGAAAMAVQAGLERGLGPLGGLQQCLVINGVLSWRGQGAAALIQNSAVCRPGTLRFWTEGEGEEMVGVAVAHRVGYQEPDRREFSVKDARQAHLWGKAGPWQEYPRRQLAWRALGFLARDVFPDVLGGFQLAEEVADFEAAPPTSPATRAAMLPPPSAPDPLMESLGLATSKASDTEKITVADAAPEEPSQDPAQAVEPAVDEPAAAPFQSHAEADRAIAAAEGQGKLFEPGTKRPV